MRWGHPPLGRATPADGGNDERLWAGQVTQATTCVRNGNGCASCDLADDGAIGPAARHGGGERGVGLVIFFPPAKGEVRKGRSSELAPADKERYCGALLVGRFALRKPFHREITDRGLLR